MSNQTPELSSDGRPGVEDPKSQPTRPLLVVLDTNLAHRRHDRCALKSKGVPVLWVGLPAIRGTKSTADMAYLDDLYRHHAEKAGIIYVDVWDGFPN